MLTICSELSVDVSSMTKVVVGDSVYMMGGLGLDSISDKIYKIDTSNNLKFIEMEIRLPKPMLELKAVVYKNVLYIIDCFDDNLKPSVKIYSSKIINDKFTEFEELDIQLDICYFEFISNDHGLYIIGGNKDKPVRTVYRSHFKNDKLVSFIEDKITLPIGISNPKCFMSSEFMYLLGGQTYVNDSNNILISHIDTDGSIGIFTQYNIKLPERYIELVIEKTDKYVIVSGLTAKSNRTDIYLATLTNDKMLSEFKKIGSGLDTRLTGFNIVANNDNLYLFGGVCGDKFILDRNIYKVNIGKNYESFFE